MKRKSAKYAYSVAVVMAVIGIIVLAGCGAAQEELGAASAEPEFGDGIYRGSFIDRGEVQVSLQFGLQRNIVTEIEYRHLVYRGSDCIDAPWGPQYQQAIQYLVGKDIRDHLDDLYTPGNFVDDVDTFTGATIRATKVRSAIKDALNRDAYSR